MRSMNWWKKNWCTKCGEDKKLHLISCKGKDCYVGADKILYFELCDDCISEIKNDPELYKSRMHFTDMEIEEIK